MENYEKTKKWIKYKNSFTSTDAKEISTIVALSMTTTKLTVGLVQ